MKTLTSSSLSKFRDCPRRYFFAYELSRAPMAVSGAMSFGKTWHSCMERWWSDGGMSAVVAYLSEHAGDVDPVDASKIAALMSYYNPPRDEWEVLGIEESFCVRIGNPWGGQSMYGYRLAGKIDLVLRNRATDAIWIADHKTTSRELIGFGTFWQALQIDGQMNNYCLASDATGFVYDAVRVPQIRLCSKDQKQAALLNIQPSEAYQLRCEVDIRANPELWYQWREYPKTAHDVQEAASDLWQQVRMFHDCARAGRWPRNCNACVGMYGSCPYLPVCTGMATIDDDSMYRTKEGAHEELIPEAAQ